MHTKPETYEDQSSYSVLMQVEAAFEDIYLLFGLFNSNPVEVLDLLRNDSSDREHLKEVLAKREYFSTNPSFGPSSVIFRSFKIAAHREDVSDWINKRLFSLTNLFPLLEHELGLTEPGSHKYTYWTKKYRHLFDRLSKQLTVFEEKTCDKVSEQIDDRTVDWKDFHKTMQSYPNFIKWHIMQYSTVFSQNLAILITSTTPITYSLISFEDYLVGKSNNEILPALKKQYTDRKPRYIACMLFALSDFGLIDKSIFDDDKTGLHSALVKTFGNIGSRTALNDALLRLRAPSRKQSYDMQKEKTKIAAMLKN